MARILVVDDEISIAEIIKTLFSADGHEVTMAHRGSQAIENLKNGYFDLMITDLKLPDADGISLFTRGKEFQPHMQVIVMTAYAGVETAVEAMRRGAFHYLTKPFKIDEMQIYANQALSYSMAMVDNAVMRSTLKTHLHFDAMVGESEPMLRIYRLVEKIAKTKSTAMILGESGTGKELVAKALHLASPRSNAQFVAINCSAMPESLLESELFGYKKGSFTGAFANKKGLFETADGGTIFLDEIGSIPSNIQAKLLRVLQEGEIRPVGGTENIKVDVRVVAATNENLENAIKEGKFREDLYYRLSVIPILVPPLRDRTEDIPMLAWYFLDHFNTENKRRVDMDEEVLDALKNHDWPGNVRELENLVKRLATLCETDCVSCEDLPPNMRPAASTAPKKLKQPRMMAPAHSFPYTFPSIFPSKAADSLKTTAVIPMEIPSSHPHPRPTTQDVSIAEEAVFKSVQRGRAATRSNLAFWIKEATSQLTESQIIPLKDYVQEVEKEYLRKVIALCAGSKEAAAKKIQVSVATIYRKLDIKKEG